MTLQCAILDDYQDVALSIADWSPLKDRVNIISFTRHMDNISELAEVLADKDIIVIMRERTPFPQALFERLLRLKLLVTTGLRNAAIDLDAAHEHGVVVCGTDSRKEPPMELA
jgi:phosphoglycerate dehydrogenase-like enzyme